MVACETIVCAGVEAGAGAAEVDDAGVAAAVAAADLIRMVRG